MTGGNNGSTTGQTVEKFLESIENYSFNALAVISDNESISQTLWQSTQRE